MATQGDDVFRAVADPTRRSILELLRGGERSVQEIAERYPVSRPAISKHLRILKEALLVDEQRRGRQRLYRLRPRPLEVVGSWLAVFARPAPAAPSGEAARPRRVERAPAAAPARGPGRRRPRRPEPAPADQGTDWRVW